MSSSRIVDEDEFWQRGDTGSNCVALLQQAGGTRGKQRAARNDVMVTCERIETVDRLGYLRQPFSVLTGKRRGEC